MPVIGRGRGKYVTKGKLFSSGGNITTRDPPPSNGFRSVAAAPATDGWGAVSNNTAPATDGWGAVSNNATSTTDAWGNVHSDTNTDRFSDPDKEVEFNFQVYNSNLPRIIGKQGSSIHNIKAESSTEIDIQKRESDGVTTQVIIKGSQLNCDHAKKMIDEICVKFNGLCNDAGGTSTSNGGSAFGGMAGGGDDGPSEDEDIWIPEDKCGKVIGRGGSKIGEIQDDTGCNVKVHGRETAEDGKVKVTLSGSAGQRAKAKSIIEGLTADRGGGFTMPADAEPLEMWVESSRLGRVVGKGGIKIREIQDTYSVRVDIKKEEIKDDDTLVVLTGSPSNTQQAKEFIDDLTERQLKADFGDSGGGDAWGQPAAEVAW